MIRSVGLDLGQSRDYTAIAAADDDGERWIVHSLGRLPLGTPYPEVVKRVAGMVRNMPQPFYLVADATGVGRPVIDMLREAGASPIPVSIIGKGRTSRNLTGAWSVPKVTLMHRVAVAMEQGRLKITCDDAMAKALAHEAHSFVRTMTKLGNVTCGGRGAHDDLILAVGPAPTAPRPRHAWRPRRRLRRRQPTTIPRIRPECPSLSADCARTGTAGR